MINEQQKEQRKLGIGGSDMSIILGLSSYKTPYQLYLEKKGLISNDDKMSPEQEMGNLLEPVIRDLFAKTNNVTVETPDTIIHPFIDFMRGNIDGYIVEWDHVLEIKTSGNINEWGEEGSDFIPLSHLVQVAYYCALMNVTHGHIGVLIGHYGFRYRQYKYRRDFELEKTILEAAKGFWNAIQNDIPPPATQYIDLKLMYPNHTNGKYISAEGDIHQHLITLNETKAKIKELQAIEEESRFKVMHYMNDAECLLDEYGKPLVTWKTNKKGTRTFLLKGDKS